MSTTKMVTKLVREGDLVAEVAVELRDDAGAWSPTMSVDDAAKLDRVRAALLRGDVSAAGQVADHVYRLTPVATGGGR